MAFSLFFFLGSKPHYQRRYDTFMSKNLEKERGVSLSGAGYSQGYIHNTEVSQPELGEPLSSYGYRSSGTNLDAVRPASFRAFANIIIPSVSPCREHEQMS
jgi:hypothetical protein